MGIYMTQNDDILVRLSSLKPKEQWEVIYHLIHEQLGDKPERGAALTDAKGRPYLFIVPPHLLERENVGTGEHRSSGRSVNSRSFLKILASGKEPSEIVKSLNEIAHEKRSR